MLNVYRLETNARLLALIFQISAVAKPIPITENKHCSKILKNIILKHMWLDDSYLCHIRRPLMIFRFVAPLSEKIEGVDEN